MTRTDVDSSRNAWQCAGAALVADRRGSGFVQALILTAVLALGAASAVKALSAGIREKAGCVGEAVAKMTLALTPCPGGPPAETPGAPGPAPAGPPLDGSGPHRTLPLPESVSVCTVHEGQKGCDSEKGVVVKVKSEVKRGEKTGLDEEGCPSLELSVEATLEVEVRGGVEVKGVGGALTVFSGRKSTYQVTLPPGEAGAIERGERQAPNPVDPATIRTGESIELSEEFYKGHNLEFSYRALQTQMGFATGRALSSGVERLDAGKLRIYVGDAAFVREAMSVGVKLGSVSLALGVGSELSRADLRTVDIDVSTPAGMAAYQDFLATGHLPDPRAAGTSDPTTTQSIDYSSAINLEGTLGRLDVGGMLADKESHVTETRHADKTVETVVSARNGQVGLLFGYRGKPDGTTERSYTLQLQGVDRATIEEFEIRSGRTLAGSEDGNVRFDFTESDLREIQKQAIDQIVHELERHEPGLSRDEIERMLREHPDRLPAGPAYRIAAAKSPAEVLNLLYGLGGGNGSHQLEVFNQFMQETVEARHGTFVPGQHPESVFPGTHVKPDCP